MSKIAVDLYIMLNELSLSCPTILDYDLYYLGTSSLGQVIQS